MLMEEKNIFRRSGNSYESHYEDKDSEYRECIGAPKRQGYDPHRFTLAKQTSCQPRNGEKKSEPRMDANFKRLPLRSPVRVHSRLFVVFESA